MDLILKREEGFKIAKIQRSTFKICFFVTFRISWVRASSPFCRARTATVRRTRTSRPTLKSIFLSGPVGDQRRREGDVRGENLVCEQLCSF